MPDSPEVPETLRKNELVITGAIVAGNARHELVARSLVKADCRPVGLLRGCLDEQQPSAPLEHVGFRMCQEPLTISLALRCRIDCYPVEIKGAVGERRWPIADVASHVLR